MELGHELVAENNRGPQYSAGVFVPCGVWPLDSGSVGRVDPKCRSGGEVEMSERKTEAQGSGRRYPTPSEPGWYAQMTRGISVRSILSIAWTPGKALRGSGSPSAATAVAAPTHIVTAVTNSARRKRK